jgi:PAS domain S-box-containing protein
MEAKPWATQSVADWSALVIEAAPNAMLMIDATGRITIVNHKVEELFGYPRAQLLGQPIALLVPERFRGRHAAQVEGFVGRPKARPMGATRDLVARRADGSELPVEIGLSPISTPAGVFTLASIIDLSGTRRAQAADENLAAIVESSQDAIIGKTFDGIITTWNQGAQQLFGFTREEAIGGPISLIVPPHKLAEEREVLERIRRNERVAPFETVRRRRDDTEVEVSVSVSPVHGASKAVIGAASIIRDITQLKRRDAELQRSNAELRRSNADLEQFAYVASHDLQEPLRMVANYTELLAQRYKGQLDEKADKYIFYASDGARRMQRLIVDLLAYSRVGSHGKSLAPVSAGAALQRVLGSLGALTQQTGATIEAGPLPQVLADELQLEQLFQNLIANALKFRAERPPRVTIGARREGACWQFSVADNGIGMDMQYAERIFQMFQRLHEIGKYEGSGIGLAIAKRIVERHDGRIWLESALGVGTTFHFTLAAVEQSE